MVQYDPCTPLAKCNLLPDAYITPAREVSCWTEYDP